MRTPPPEMTFGFLIQLVFCKKKTMWFIGVEVEQETSAPPPQKNPEFAPEDAFPTMQRTGYNHTRNEQFVQRPEVPNPA